MIGKFLYKGLVECGRLGLEGKVIRILIKLGIFLKKIKFSTGGLKNYVLKTRWARILLITVSLAVLIYIAKLIFLAALVNGRPISRLTVTRELEKQGGQEVLDSLIEKSLIFQEGKKSGVKIDKTAIDEEISRIEGLLKEQNLTLDEALSMRGETRESLSKQIKLQKTVEALLAEKIKVTEQEIKDYFDNNKDSFGENAKLEDVRSDVNSQLYQQKLNAEYSKWIEELRSKAKILYLLKF